ncbi:MAG: hypothetical protein GY858_08400 [Candidatus Omnitrophica bacterium]|nr:hypothetical protein [Candidatus Omnitrophota bacterium]
MKKIKINLHPVQAQEETKLVKTAGQYMPFAILGLAGLIVANLIIFAFANVLRLSYSGRHKHWKSLSPQVQEIVQLKDELQKHIVEKKDFQNLLSEHLSFSQIMAEFFSSAPKNIWLRDMSINEETVKINGYVVKWKEDRLVSLDKLIKALNEQTYFIEKFRNVGLKNYRKSTLNGVDIIEFRMECAR